MSPKEKSDRRKFVFKAQKRHVDLFFMGNSSCCTVIFSRKNSDSFTQPETKTQISEQTQPRFAEEVPKKETEEQERNKYLPSFGFFIDSYYAHNPYRSNSRDNRYLTQPARWDEGNINLAYIDGKVETNQYRGRVAFQFGNSVNANYKNEVSSEKNSNELSVKNNSRSVCRNQTRKKSLARRRSLLRKYRTRKLDFSE